jgi:hypothetical protein
MNGVVEVYCGSCLTGLCTKMLISSLRLMGRGYLISNRLFISYIIKLLENILYSSVEIYHV